MKSSAKLTIKRRAQRTSFSSNNNSHNKESSEDVIEISPSLMSGNETLHFPIRTMVKIHRNVVLQICMFDKLKDKSTLKTSLASNWFKKEHLNEFYEYLKPFLKNQIYETIQTSLVNGKMFSVTELKHEMSSDRTLQVVKCRTIQFTFEFRKSYSNFFLLRRHDTNEEWEREKQRIQKQLNSTKKPRVSDPIIIDEEEDDNKPVIIHHLDLDDEMLKTPPSKRSVHNLDLGKMEENHGNDNVDSIIEEEDYLETKDHSKNAVQSENNSRDEVIMSPPYQKIKESLVSWKYSLIVYFEPKEKDILELMTTGAKSKYF
ncbi:hypothetical protein FDP41_010640 [Naegleria fowleri]|uniref:Uncharacterized protein n=1 Tax=Naegleria fowleri TaxID=5763 RepID=A0A6A5CDY5_NAEFO|nr:uncharacterized protein FDP41_010640 [Naegleria fowleri]KAF0983575.1 hypothetical protein FDP41_010640 [Naegleria fowleri]CAG4707856.1 unnamed protein product [Naegleria fowleri]